MLLAVTGGGASSLSATNAWAEPLSVMNKHTLRDGGKRSLTHKYLGLVQQLRQLCKVRGNPLRLGGGKRRPSRIICIKLRSRLCYARSVDL